MIHSVFHLPERDEFHCKIFCSDRVYKSTFLDFNIFKGTTAISKFCPNLNFDKITNWSWRPWTRFQDDLGKRFCSNLNPAILSSKPQLQTKSPNGNRINMPTFWNPTSSPNWAILSFSSSLAWSHFAILKSII